MNTLSHRPKTDGVDGKVVLILGAAGGIGSACARALAARGAALFLADINQDKLTQRRIQSAWAENEYGALTSQYLTKLPPPWKP